MNYQEALKILHLTDPPSVVEAKTSYRSIALQFHPDRNPNNQIAEEQFRLATEAYNYLVHHFKSWRSDEGRDHRGVRSIEPIADFEDIFDDIFGFTREDRILGYQTPEDLTLTLLEFAYGVRKRIKLLTYKKCHVCEGRGSSRQDSVTLCTYCFGSGQIQSHQNDHAMKICPKCYGRGRKIKYVCSCCNGFGRESKKSLQKIVIPAGLTEGKACTQHSEDQDTGQQHDLFIRPLIQFHPVFTVDKYDLLCEYPVSEQVARDGAILDFPSLWGWMRVDIPASSTHQSQLVLDGHGLISHPGGGKRGRLVITLLVCPDSQAGRKQKTILRQVMKGNPAYASGKKSWWKKIFS